MSNNLDRAFELVQRAIDEDAKQNYQEAYRQYQNALDYFMLALKCEKDSKSKQLLRTKIDEYLARAEALKQRLAASEKSKKNPVGVPEMATPAFLSSDLRSASNLDRAVALVRRAIVDEVNQDYAEALRQYQIALYHFMLALKYERNDESKQLIQSKVDEYLVRAETLEQQLKTAREPKNNMAETGVTLHTTVLNRDGRVISQHVKYGADGGGESITPTTELSYRCFVSSPQRKPLVGYREHLRAEIPNRPLPH